MAYLDRTKETRAKKAKAYLELLEGEDAKNLRIWIQEKDAYIEKQGEKIEEMREVFEGIAKFTNKKTVIYGS